MTAGAVLCQKRVYRCLEISNIGIDIAPAGARVEGKRRIEVDFTAGFARGIAAPVLDPRSHIGFANLIVRHPAVVSATHF